MELPGCDQNITLHMMGAVDLKLELCRVPCLKPEGLSWSCPA